MLTLAKLKELPSDMTLSQVQEMLDEQRKEKQRAKYARNRDAQLARLQRYRETHHEEILQKKREYREKHREEINAKRRVGKKSQDGGSPQAAELFPQEKNIGVE
jgi:hypothetical protein